jgi:glucan 1,6-alpha-isomaltosidase
MVTRRNLFKGGGLAAAGIAAASLSSCSTTADEAAFPTSQVLDAGLAVTVDQFRRGGVGPLYWSTYGYNIKTNLAMPQDVWSKNLDWVAENLARYGYRMVCTDGWIDYSQKTTENGYIVAYQDDWTLDWAGMVKDAAARGLDLGVYYNPLWVVTSAIKDPSKTVAGRPDIKVADIVNPGDNQNGSPNLNWVDPTRDGAEEYVKGYVEYFRSLGAVFLRIDFLAWFEAGYDQSEGTTGFAHGRDSYLTALSWMREAAGDMILSLVMPNCFDHAALERQFGDMIRIDNDVSFGTWYSLSGGSQFWQPIWSQWNNPFLGFTGFSDVSGRGQLVLDGDPLWMSTFSNDYERQTAISLFTMAGAPIAIADQYDTVGEYEGYYCNTEVLALRQSGLVGKPIYHNSHGYFFDTTSRDCERWIGQLPDGSWVVGLFNRDDGPHTTTKSIDFQSVLGLSAAANVRDLWARSDRGSMTGYQVALKPHACVLLTVTPQSPAHFETEVGAWAGTARFENSFAGYEGSGYVTGLDTAGSSVTLAIAAASSGVYRLDCHVANGTGSLSVIEVVSLDPESGSQIGSTRLEVPSSAEWTDWQTVTLSLRLSSGDNLVVFGFGPRSVGSVNIDYVAAPVAVTAS